MRWREVPLRGSWRSSCARSAEGKDASRARAGGHSVFSDLILLELLIFRNQIKVQTPALTQLKESSMKVLFKARAPRAHEMRDLTERRVRFVLRRLGWLVPRAEVQMSDVNGAR